jgi:spermidine/putrescine transport system permease protein
MAGGVEAQQHQAAAHVRREGRRSRGDGVSTLLLVGPVVIALALFFLLPLYYIWEFSTGSRWFGKTLALAKLNGELTSFSTSLWSQFLSPGVRIELLPNWSSASVHVPTIVIGVAFVVLVLLATFGGRFPEHGGLIVLGSFLLLAAPFFTIPAGDHLYRLASLSSDSTPLRLFFKSVSMAMTSSVIAVIIAFPIAYYLAFCLQKTKYTWLLIVITPFLTSYLLRIFAWKVILGDEGLVNSGLQSLGVIHHGHPLSFLIYSQFTVILVLTYAWVPFICLPIFISLETIDRRLLEAATDLGASRFTAFRKVTLPLAAPGIVAAFLFVFIPSIGEYITPSLVGGVRGYMFGQAVYDSFLGGAFDWQGGSVLALFLLGTVLFLTAATAKFLRAGGGAT